MVIQLSKKIGAPIVTFNANTYKTAYRDYRQGTFRTLIELMRRAEVDSQVSGCLKGRRAGFQQAWQVTAFDDTDQFSERAETTRNMIENLDHYRLFKDIFDARMKKFSVIDFDWEVENSLHKPVKHKKIEHQYFRYDPKDGILKIDSGRSLQEIPPEALVCETEELPEMLPVLRDFILKDFGLESWASFIETFGEGIIIGKYPPGADGEFKDEIETAVNAIARSSRGTMPEGGNLELIETNRTTGDHEKFVDVANRGISIQILGHANAVEQSRGLQVGENLTQFKVKREIAIDDMYFIDNYMQQLIRIIEDRNYGDSKYSKFGLDKKEPVNVKEWLDVLDLAHAHGLSVNADEYRKLGLVIEDEGFIQKQNPLEL